MFLFADTRRVALLLASARFRIAVATAEGLPTVQRLSSLVLALGGDAFKYGLSKVRSALWKFLAHRCIFVKATTNIRPTRLEGARSIFVIAQAAFTTSFSTIIPGAIKRVAASILSRIFLALRFEGNVIIINVLGLAELGAAFPEEARSIEEIALAAITTPTCAIHGAALVSVASVVVRGRGGSNTFWLKGNAILFVQCLAFLGPAFHEEALSTCEVAIAALATVTTRDGSALKLAIVAVF